MRQGRQAVYTITCDPTGNQYIGSSIDVEKRWEVHRLALKRGKHHSSLLQHAYDIHGPDAFTFDVLEDVAEYQQLERREQYWIDLRHPAFNILGTPRHAERCKQAYHPPVNRVLPHIKMWRDARWLTQENLAKTAHLSIATVQHAEHGYPVSNSTVRKLAAAFNVTPAELCAEVAVA